MNKSVFSPHYLTETLNGSNVHKNNDFQSKWIEKWILKIDFKMNSTIIMKNYEADLGEGFPTKMILRPFWLMNPSRQRQS